MYDVPPVGAAIETQKAEEEDWEAQMHQTLDLAEEEESDAGEAA